MRLLIFGALFLLSSCIKTNNSPSVFVPKFILEGVIAEGEYPVIQLMHNIPSNYVIDTAQLETLVIRWATVKVSGEGEEEVLTLIKDNKRFPYFFYVGRRLKGKAGGQYRVEATFSDIKLSALTQIPLAKPRVDSLWFIPMPDKEKKPMLLLHTAAMGMADNYLFSSKAAQSTLFHGNRPMGLRAKDLSKKSDTVAIVRVLGLLDKNRGSKYYASEDDVTIKVANVSAESYQLWMDHGQQSLQYSLLNYSGNFTGNIEGPAIGIWYGANELLVKGF